MRSIETTSLFQRFQRYVQIETTSNPNTNDYPTAEGEKQFAEMLVAELKEMGVEKPYLNKDGYVFGFIPARGCPAQKALTIALIAHLDTSPDVSGKGVEIQIHPNYAGGDIVINQPKGLILKPEAEPELKKLIGHDILTAKGETLLGADDKAGVAIIMDYLDRILKDKGIPHPNIRILFTPDEEVGRGTEKLDLNELKADFAYTVDGGPLGEIDVENFNAYAGTVTLSGLNVHPGYAKDKMLNSILAGAALMSKFDRAIFPENTEKRAGYIFFHEFSGTVEKTVLKILLRDFELEKISQQIELIQAKIKEIEQEYKGLRIEAVFKESYLNMKEKLKAKPEVVELALQAVKDCGIEPIRQIIRGGTDGARLSNLGLLTPNLFTGGVNFHSVKEWVSFQVMQKSVEVIERLMVLWSGKSL